MSHPFQVRLGLEGDGKYLRLVRAIAKENSRKHYPSAKELVPQVYGETYTDNKEKIKSLQTILKKSEWNGLIGTNRQTASSPYLTYYLNSLQIIDSENRKVDLSKELVKVEAAAPHQATPQEALDPLSPAVPTATPQSGNLLAGSILAMVVPVSYLAVTEILAPKPNTLYFVILFFTASLLALIGGFMLSANRRRSEGEA